MTGMLGDGSQKKVVDHDCQSSSASDDVQGTAHGVIRVAAVVFGVGALVACGFMAFVASGTTTRGGGDMTARMLLDSPEVHAVATRNLVKIGRQTLGGEIREEMVRSRVADNFKAIGRMMDAQLPDVSRVLKSVPLTEEQTHAVLHMAGYLSDPRLQQIGLDVAHAIRDADTHDPAVLKLRIAERLGSRRAELRQLYREVIPASQRTVFTGAGRGLNELLEPSRVKLLKSFSDGWNARFSRTSQRSTDVGLARMLGMVPTAEPTTEEKLRTSEQVISSIGAASEEATAILRIIQPICELFGKTLDVPALVTSVLGALDFVLEVTACSLGAAADHNPISSISCPILSSSAAFDAMREVFTLLGLLDDGNTKNGITGNVDGGPVTYGVFDGKKGILG